MPPLREPSSALSPFRAEPTHFAPPRKPNHSNFKNFNSLPSHHLPHFLFQTPPPPHAIAQTRRNLTHEKIRIRKATRRQSRQRRPIHRTPLPRRQIPLRP